MNTADFLRGTGEDLLIQKRDKYKAWLGLFIENRKQENNTQGCHEVVSFLAKIAWKTEKKKSHTTTRS